MLDSCATLFYGAVVYTSCENARADTPAQQVETTELIRTSQSLDGAELPDYLLRRPELVAVKYVFSLGVKLGWHYHVAINYGVLRIGRIGG